MGEDVGRPGEEGEREGVGERGKGRRERELGTARERKEGGEKERERERERRVGGEERGWQEGSRLGRERRLMTLCLPFTIYCM